MIGPTVPWVNLMIGRMFSRSYRALVRLKFKLFSLMIGGAFGRFGKRTVLQYPIRLSGEDRIELGDDVFIAANSWLQTLADGTNWSPALFVGNGTSIAGSCVISAARRVVLEENVLLARNVYISDHSHRFTDRTLPVMAQGIDKIAAVLIRRGAWLGQNVVIFPGVTVGVGAVVGANSIVKDDVPDWCVAVGSPARVVKTIDGTVHA